MAGQAVVSIRDKQWDVSLALTSWELTQGLGGIHSMAPQTGMLFDMGWMQTIHVTTVPMLFPLDIAFLSDALIVTEIYRNIQPGYLVTSERLAQYFIEVNAGELEGIDVSDQVSVELVPSEVTPLAIPDWLGAMLSLFGFMIVTGLMVGMVRGANGETSENPGHHSPGSDRPKVLPGGGVHKKKHVKAAYLSNWQYGGYSFVEENPARPSDLWTTGSVDYADPDKIIAIAEEAKLPHIHLAGRFWGEIGYEGYGQKVSIKEAKTALAKAKERMLGKHQGEPKLLTQLSENPIIKESAAKLTRDDVEVDSWSERDRLGIWVTDKKIGKTIAEWWDDSAREMFQDGFFEEADYIRGQKLVGRKFEQSILDYLEHTGVLKSALPPSGEGLHHSGPFTLQELEGIEQYTELAGKLAKSLKEWWSE